MASRKIKDANIKFFSHYAHQSQGSYWFFSNKASKDFFIKSEIKYFCRISPDKALMVLKFDEIYFLCTYGLKIDHRIFEEDNVKIYSQYFDDIIWSDNLFPQDEEAKTSVVSSYQINLDELERIIELRDPQLSPDTYSDALEYVKDLFRSSLLLIFLDKEILRPLPVNSSATYSIEECGTPYLAVRDNFPEISVFPLSDEYFIIGMIIKYMLAESGVNNSWIHVEESLAESLVSISEIPNNFSHIEDFEDLFKSILDVSPQSLFLSLYRFLEKLYAWSKVSSFSAELGISEDKWEFVAETLEDKLKWYPREEQSLIELFDEVDDSKLLPIYNIGRETQDNFSNDGGTEPKYHSICAKFIYTVRNSYVHSRKGNRLNFKRLNEADFSKLCSSLVPIVVDLYGRIYK